MAPPQVAPGVGRLVLGSCSSLRLDPSVGIGRSLASGLASLGIGGRQQFVIAARERGPRGASAARDGDPRVAHIKSTIRAIPDWPKKGIVFRDITTLLLDHKAFQDTTDMFIERYKDRGITAVAGVEARGFIFGPPIALGIGAKFVCIRKPKKLPGSDRGPCRMHSCFMPKSFKRSGAFGVTLCDISNTGDVISEEYALEYGTDKVEMHLGALGRGDNVLLVDDLVATGGTLGAGIRLIERTGAEVAECACVIELPDLKGREKLGSTPLYVLIEYGGH